MVQFFSDFFFFIITIKTLYDQSIKDLILNFLILILSNFQFLDFFISLILPISSIPSSPHYPFKLSKMISPVSTLISLSLLSLLASAAPAPAPSVNLVLETAAISATPGEGDTATVITVPFRQLFNAAGLFAMPSFKVRTNPSQKFRKASRSPFPEEPMFPLPTL